MDEDGTPVIRYALGHSDEELDRLETQARIVAPITRGFWTAAGIGPGMRVLDVGCGAGHTTRLVADLVGTSGRVVGIDNAEQAVAIARARSVGAEHVSYLVGDPMSAAFDAPFDAAVGRYVVMFQPEPAAFLAAVARHVKPGGIVSFHELDASGVTSSPPVPTYERVAAWTPK